MVSQGLIFENESLFFPFASLVTPLVKLIPQNSVCLCEWPRSLKFLATPDLDRSDPCFSHQVLKCSQKRFTKFSAKFSNVEFVAESKSDAVNDIWGCVVEIIVYLINMNLGSFNMCFRLDECTGVVKFIRAIESSWFYVGRKWTSNNWISQVFFISFERDARVAH